MNNEEIRVKLSAVVRELNKVEVRGSDNLRTLLSVITYLNGIVDGLKEETPNEE